ncbi:MbtH family protein [Rhodopseudomonas palustris]|uniref:MbtH-like protein n=1 Tax=Rhodopseudomonas palustris (strain BisB18) TaxID=316056 RepID=Q217L8_RHOPB
MRQDEDDNRQYAAVKNPEEQYSIWPIDQPVPAGWTAAGCTGSKQHCLSFIKEVWTDMRPLSLRGQLGRSAGG